MLMAARVHNRSLVRSLLGIAQTVRSCSTHGQACSADTHTPSAVGMAELPFDISVEIEAIFEIDWLLRVACRRV